MSKIPLRNLLSLVQKRFLQTNPTPPPPSSSSSKQPSFKSALSVSKSLRTPRKSSSESTSVVNCLKSYGFEKTHIAKLVAKRPDILHCRVDTNLKPKLEFFFHKGFTGKLLPDLIVSNPCIFDRSLNSCIKPTLEFLSTFLKDEKLLVALKRSSSWLLTFNRNAILQPNVDLLISEGIPASGISRLLVLQPRVVLQSRDRMVYAVRTVKEIGLKPNEPRFIHALRVICSMSELNWKKKLEAFMSLGWSKEEVLNTFRKDPICLACSEKKIRYLMDFFVNTMKLDAKTIIAYPKLLLYSADKRIIARYKVLKVLESRNLIKEDKKIVWVLTVSEKKFLEEYITKHRSKVPGLLHMYKHVVKQRITMKSKNEKSHPKSASLTPVISA